MDEPSRPRWSRMLGLVPLVGWGLLSGCAMIPRDRLDESQRLAQSLRDENARLKDEVVGLKTQNRDYADRALDDLRRLTARDDAIQRLEQNVQDYQDDRDRLAAAYRRLAVSLGRSAEDGAVESTSGRVESSRDPSAAVPVAAHAGRASEPPAPDDDGEDGGGAPRPPGGRWDP